MTPLVIAIVAICLVLSPVLNAVLTYWLLRPLLLQTITSATRSAEDCEKSEKLTEEVNNAYVQMTVVITALVNLITLDDNSALHRALVKKELAEAEAKAKAGRSMKATDRIKPIAEELPHD